MRFFAVASLFSLAAALPAATAPVEQGASLVTRDSEVAAPVAVRSDDVTLLVARAPFDKTYSWPAQSTWGGSEGAQFEATNLGNGKYRFDFYQSGPANGGNTKFRVSSAGNTLAEKILSPGASASVEVQQTGSNFNVFIDQA